MMQHLAHAIDRQLPRGLPDRAAGRRAARGSDRDAAHGARRGHQLDLRRARRAPRAGRRDGDRARQAPGRDEEGRGDPARLDHPPGARLQQRAAVVGQGADRRRRRQRAAAAEALLRRGAQHRGRRLAHHHRHRADRHRQPHGRGDLRGIQGHRQLRDPPRPPDVREARLPVDPAQQERHAARGAAAQARDPAEDLDPAQAPLLRWTRSRRWSSSSRR